MSNARELAHPDRDGDQLLFWEVANRQLGTREPWDSPDYLAAYGCSLALAPLASLVFPRRAWLWGIIITFSQIVIMGIHNGGGR